MHGCLAVASVLHGAEQHSAVRALDAQPQPGMAPPVKFSRLSNAVTHLQDPAECPETVGICFSSFIDCVLASLCELGVMLSTKT